MIKGIFRLFVPKIVVSTLRSWQQKKSLNEWKSNGCPDPTPHIVKQMTIKEYHEKYKYEILVETGTYLGDMVEAQKKRFKKVYSIELKHWQLDEFLSG